MNRSEQNVKMASDLYEARRAAKFLLGKSYQETLKGYRDLIATAMQREQLPVLRAVLAIVKTMPTADGIPLMCLMAAAVEMIEAEPEMRLN